MPPPLDCLTKCLGRMSLASIAWVHSGVDALADVARLCDLAIFVTRHTIVNLVATLPSDFSLYVYLLIRVKGARTGCTGNRH